MKNLTILFLKQKSPVSSAAGRFPFRLGSSKKTFSLMMGSFVNLAAAQIFKISIESYLHFAILSPWLLKNALIVVVTGTASASVTTVRMAAMSAPSAKVKVGWNVKRATAKANMTRWGES